METVVVVVHLIKNLADSGHFLSIEYTELFIKKLPLTIFCCSISFKKGTGAGRRNRNWELMDLSIITNFFNWFCLVRFDTCLFYPHFCSECQQLYMKNFSMCWPLFLKKNKLHRQYFFFSPFSFVIFSLSTIRNTNTTGICLSYNPIVHLLIYK